MAMKKRKHALEALIVVTLIALIAMQSIANASSGGPEIYALQPLGTSNSPAFISGVYDFMAYLSLPSGDTINSVKFHIAASWVTPNQGTSSTNPSTGATDINYNYSFDAGALQNGQYAWDAYAVVDSTNYSSSTNYFVVDNPLPNPSTTLWNITYYQSAQSMTEYMPATLSGQYYPEGHYQMDQGSMYLYPNSLTSKIAIEPPNTVAGMSEMWLPITASAYYQFNTTSASNWLPLTDALHASGNDVLSNNSPFGTPSLTVFPNSPVAANYAPTVGNLSAAVYTIGGVFDLSTPKQVFLGANNVSLSFVAWGINSNTFEPAVTFHNATYGSTTWIISNTSMQTGKPFSFAVSLNHVSFSSSSPGTFSLYIDGTPVGYHIANTFGAGIGIEGMNVSGNGGYLLSNDTSNVTVCDLFVANTTLSISQINQLVKPIPWQIFAKINPPFYTVSENYYSITMENGSEPWSGVQLNVLNLTPIPLSTVTLSYNYALGVLPFYGEPPNSFALNVSFTPYFSISSNYFHPAASIFRLPEWSSANLHVTDSYGQAIGTLSNFLIASQSTQASVYLNITTLQFVFVNASEGFVNLAYGSTNLSYYSTAYVANNSVYDWSVSIYSLLNGKQEKYAGSVATDTPTQTLTIYANPPPASLTVAVFAYDGSGQGEVTTSGSPSINLFINHARYPAGDTFNGHVDQTVNITVTDQLNQTLYASNYTLMEVSNSLVISIKSPSYILEMHNDEQAPPNSTLATEVIKVTNRATGVNASFKNSVGQSLDIYLLQGNYTLYLHDNATFNANVTLNQSEFYIIFGQQLLTLQEFNAKQNEIYNNTAHLMVTPVVAPVDSLQGSPIQYRLDLQFPNGTSLNDSNTRGIVQNGTFAFYLNANGTLATQATLLAGSSSDVMAQLTISKPGSYNGIFLSFISSSGSIFSMRYSATLQILSLSNFSYGIKVALSGPLTVQVNHTASFFVLLTYSNGSALNYSDTLSAQHNITVTVYHDGLFIATLPVSLVSAGKLTFTYTPLQLSSGYSIIVIVSPTTIGTAKASAESTLSFSAVGYNPTLSPSQDVLNSLVRFLSGSTNLIVILITIAGGLYGTYRFLRRRRIRLEQKLEAVDSAIQAQIIAQNLTAEQRQAVIRAIPVKVKRKLINVITGKEAVE